MATYYCHVCDNYIDNDYHPGEEFGGILICPSCAETAPPKAPAHPVFTSDQLAFIKKMEEEAEREDEGHICYEDNQGMCHNGCGRILNTETAAAYFGEEKLKLMLKTQRMEDE